MSTNMANSGASRYMPPHKPETYATTAKVAVVGSINMDFINFVDSHPPVGGHVMATKSIRAPGGHGVNQAVTCARLRDFPRAFLVREDYRSNDPAPHSSGLEVFMFGAIGDDTWGDEIKAELKKNRVNIDGVRTIKGEVTGYAHISVDDSGEPTVNCTPGAYGNFVPGPLFDPKIVPDIVLVQLEIPEKMVLHALEWAKKHKAMTVCNAAPAQRTVKDEIFKVDHFIVNEQQADILNGYSGKRFENRPVERDEIRQHYQNLCEEFHENGATCVIITIAELGVVGSKKDLASGIRQQYVFDAEKGEGLPVMDTTGASDAFIGGYTVELVHQKQAGVKQDIASAIRLGIKAAGLTISQAGSMPAIPLSEDILNTTFCVAGT